MSIVVGYIPTREGRAALRRAAAEAELRKADLIVINSDSGKNFDPDDTLRFEAALEGVQGRLVQAGINAMQGSPATFAMGDYQAGQVAEATDVLAPTQTLHWDTIHRLVTSLQTLGDLTQAMADDVYVSTYPWMRPAGIGIDTGL